MIIGFTSSSSTIRHRHSSVDSQKPHDILVGGGERRRPTVDPKGIEGSGRCVRVRWIGCWVVDFWHGQSGSGFGQIGQCRSPSEDVGRGVTAIDPLRSIPGIDLNCLSSSLNPLTSDNSKALSSSHPFGTPSEACLVRKDSISDFNRSLSAFNARATSCRRTLEDISSFSNCRIRSSRVLI